MLFPKTIIIKFTSFLNKNVNGASSCKNQHHNASVVGLFKLVAMKLQGVPSACFLTQISIIFWLLVMDQFEKIACLITYKNLLKMHTVYETSLHTVKPLSLWLVAYLSNKSIITKTFQSQVDLITVKK